MLMILTPADTTTYFLFYAEVRSLAKKKIERRRPFVLLQVHNNDDDDDDVGTGKFVWILSLSLSPTRQRIRDRRPTISANVMREFKKHAEREREREREGEGEFYAQQKQQ